MKVQARCTAKCWDSGGEALGFPSMLTPGEFYDIPPDGQLARLTVTAVAYDDNGKSIRWYRTPQGELKSMPVPKPPYVFEFDRNITRTNEGAVVEKDYSCKKCGVEFSSLAALGRHANAFHKNDDLIPDDEPVVKRPDGRKKPRTFTCKTCGEVIPNLYALRVHNKTHENTAETSAVPA